MSFDLRKLYEQLTAGEETYFWLVPVRAVVRWVVLFYKQLAQDKAFIRAAGMAYITLVALVPMLLLVFGVLSAIGLLKPNQKAVESIVYSSAPWLAEIPEVREILLPGLMGVDLGALGVVGVVGLFVVAARLYLMVERAYNDIFGVVVDRAFGFRLLNFYFTLTAVPIALLVAVLSTEELVRGVGYRAPVQWVTSALIFGLLLTALKLFPCTRVSWRAAALGAFVSGVLLELGGRMFPLYIRWFASDDPLRVVYGSLGLIPIFLLWLYLLWIFVLLGVEIAYVAQNFGSLVAAELEQLERRRSLLRETTVGLALEAAARVGAAFQQGHGPVQAEELADACGVSGKDLHAVLRVLEQAEVLLRTDAGWTVARPPAVIQIPGIVDRWRRLTSVRNPDGDRVGDAVHEAMIDKLDGTLADGIEWWLGDRPALSAAPAAESVPRLVP